MILLYNHPSLLPSSHGYSFDIRVRECSLQCCLQATREQPLMKAFLSTVSRQSVYEDVALKLCRYREQDEIETCVLRVAGMEVSDFVSYVKTCHAPRGHRKACAHKHRKPAEFLLYNRCPSLHSHILYFFQATIVKKSPHDIFYEDQVTSLS